jgi:branched-chain amino acid transport system permease protein
MRIGDAATSYMRDEAFLRTPTQKVWLMILFAGLGVFPFIASDYFLYQACLVGITIIGATGLNVLSGFTGQISIGHSGFLGIGAYSAAWLASAHGLPLEVTLPFGVLLTTIVGILVGLPSLRVKGLYLAIATMAAAVTFEFIVVHWKSVTGGDIGLSVKPARLFTIELNSDFRMYWIIMILAVILVAAARNLFRTRIGRAFIAIRDRDISAEVLGINLHRYKLMSFAISSAYAGCAGVLFAYFFKVVTPESFPLSMSIFYLAAIIVGGMGSILGGVLGAIFMTLMPEVLGLITKIDPDAPVILASMREIVFGALIIGFLLFEPDGLVEFWRRIRRFFPLWPFKT